MSTETEKANTDGFTFQRMRMKFEVVFMQFSLNILILVLSVID